MNSRKDAKCDQCIPDDVIMCVKKHNYKIEQFEPSASFGNILLEVSKDNILLRFIRDRGTNFCEICRDRKTDRWEEYDYWRMQEKSHSDFLCSDFYDFVMLTLDHKR